MFYNIFFALKSTWIWISPWLCKKGPNTIWGQLYFLDWTWQLRILTTQGNVIMGTSWTATGAERYHIPHLSSPRIIPLSCLLDLFHAIWPCLFGRVRHLNTGGGCAWQLEISFNLLNSEISFNLLNSQKETSQTRSLSMVALRIFTWWCELYKKGKTSDYLT